MGKPSKQRPSGNRLELLINLIAILIFVVLAVCFVSSAIATQLLTPALIAALVAVVVVLLVVVWLLRRSHRPGVRMVGSVWTMICCLLFAVGIGYIRVGLDTLDRIATPDPQTISMTLYVNQDDPRTLPDLGDKPFGVLASETTSAQAAVEKLEQEHGVTLTIQPYDTPSQLLEALSGGDVDAILVSQSQLEGSAVSRLRNVQTVAVALTSSQQSQNTAPSAAPVDQVFTLYISGNDTRSNDINDTERSDVNIIATVNPKTRQILLLSTPRDYYIPLSISNGVEDKLTHAGKYGIDVSMVTLEMLYDIKLDYYFKVNFSGFEQIIDALGGIDVDSQYDFSSTISETPIHYSKGINHLNGEEALFYVRERYSFAKGDLQRGIHQMQVIQAVAKKAMSPSILLQYVPMMDAMADCFRTSVPSQLITALVRDQLSSGGEWNIVTYYVSGHEEKHSTYSAPNSKASVIIPDQSTVETAQKLMEQVRNGEILSNPGA